MAGTDVRVRAERSIRTRRASLIALVLVIVMAGLVVLNPFGRNLISPDEHRFVATQ